jgi:hypothetical protein
MIRERNLLTIISAQLRKVPSEIETVLSEVMQLRQEDDEEK